MKRPYRQTARAQQAEETGERILRAAIRLFDSKGYAGLTLADVAEAADVTVQTVIRRFGDKEGLLTAAGRIATENIRSQRDDVVAGDVPALVDNLLTHYEEYAASALRLLADEHLSPAIATYTEAGRAYHREWCRRVFAPFLTDLSPTVRRRRLAQFIAICDVWTWKLLRLQAGLSLAQTRTALLEMLAPLTEGTPSQGRRT
ncbi:helix-turn-helix domain-containing protein [Ammonicoccus fulvus]|uniref:Helix-turn-helix domain-containing protein n=1 Tax=Ammonicoccus fulvus TaxID=3138240 RepID=A0ABZ3FVS6_9ACTN